MLKSGAAELVGHGAFALLTKAAVEHAEVPVEASLPIVETYEHYAPVEARVFPLRAW